MTLTDAAQILGNIGEFLGFIGIVATLVYLSRQVHGTALVLNRQISRDRATDLQKIVLNAPHLSTVIAKINSIDSAHVHPTIAVFMDRYDLSMEEADQYLRFQIQAWKGYEADFHAGDFGAESAIRSGLAKPVQAIFFKNARAGFSIDFVEYVDGLEPWT